MGHWPRCSPVVAGQDLFPEFVGVQPPGRYLGEQCQVPGAGFQPLGAEASAAATARDGTQ
jgi:hypothetical protein